MSNLNERLEQLNGQLAEWEAQDPRNQSKIDAIKAEIARIKEQIAETEAREQKTGELLDEYNDTLNNIFDALFPADKFRVILGDTEYNQLRQDYKKVHHAYHSDQIEKINADHAAEIETWRQKCECLDAIAKEQAKIAEGAIDAKTDSEGQNVTLKIELGDARDAANSWERRAKELEQEMEDLHGDVRRLKELNTDLREKYTELESRYQREKTKEPAKTEALDNVLNEIKSRKKMDPDDIMRRFQARQQNGPKVMSIEHGKIELPELPFRGEVAAPTVPEAPVEQFQSPENKPIGVPVSEDGTGGGVEESPITRAEFEAKMTLINEAFAVLTRRTGGPITEDELRNLRGDVA